jgi:hypothetical protein
MSSVLGQCGNRRDKLRIAALLTPCCAGAQLRSSRLALLASDADYKKVRLYSGDGLFAFAPLGGEYPGDGQPAFASLGVGEFGRWTVRLCSARRGRIRAMDLPPLLRSAWENSGDELFAFASLGVGEFGRWTVRLCSARRGRIRAMDLPPLPSARRGAFGRWTVRLCLRLGVTNVIARRLAAVAIYVSGGF